MEHNFSSNLLQPLSVIMGCRTGFCTAGERDWQSAGLKGIGCKSVLLVYFAAFNSQRAMEQLLAFKIVKIYSHPVAFSLRFFKSAGCQGKISDWLQPCVRLASTLEAA